LGYPTIPEAARIFIDDEMSHGRSVEDIRADETEFQRIVLEMKIALEDRIPPDRLTFLERGIPDSIAYYKLLGLDTRPIIDASNHRRYKGIFILEPLEFVRDYARTEDDETVNMLDGLLYDSYSALGYKVNRVPVLPRISERAQFVLDDL